MKPVHWIGSSKEDLCAFPEDVRRQFGYGLHLAQTGLKHSDAKPLKGFSGASVVELIDDYDGDTYRAVYTIKFQGTIYVLHAFQKKSSHGIATPKHHIDLINQRLKQAEQHYKSLKEATR